MTNQKVGSVYEIAINDVGYMLADSLQRPVRRQTAVLDTQPPGSDAPLSERIGRYDFVSSTDWTGGEGQEMADRENSDASRYFYSEGIDPFTTPGQITCLPAMTEVITDNDASHAVVASDSVFVKTAAGELTELADTEAVPSAFTTGLAGTISDLASDGTYWYATDGATIRRNNTDANPAANWSAEDVTTIEWCTDRIMGFDNVASPAELISFSPAGVGTVLAATHGVGFTLRGLCGGDGFVWYGANTATNGGHVRYWQVDSAPINTGVALTLPTDETVDNLFFYLGNVFVASLTADPSGVVFHKIYRCVPSDGLLTPQLVVDGIYSFGSFATKFAGLDRFVAFAWPNMMRIVQGGIGVIDLETGGYARWFAGGPDEAVFSKHTFDVVAWNGKFGFTVQDTGFFAPVTGPDYVTGLLETSTSDLATPALKHLDEISVSTLPLPTSGGVSSVAVAYSIDGGANYTTLATHNTAAATRHSTELTTAVRSPTLRLRLTLAPTGDGSDKPTVTTHVAKTHVTGIVDQIIELPVNCEDYIADVNNTMIVEDSGPGKGMARYRALQALIGVKVLFQDVDWKATQEESLCEVVGVESTSVQVFNQNRNVNDTTGHVAVVSLRSPYTA